MSPIKPSSVQPGANRSCVPAANATSTGIAPHFKKRWIHAVTNSPSTSSTTVSCKRQKKALADQHWSQHERCLRKHEALEIQFEKEDKELVNNLKSLEKQIKQYASEQHADPTVEESLNTGNIKLEKLEKEYLSWLAHQNDKLHHCLYEARAQLQQCKKLYTQKHDLKWSTTA